MSEWREGTDSGDPGEEEAIKPPPAGVANEPPVDEQAILERCIEGDQEAFEILVDRYYHRVFGFCRRLLGPRREYAEDLTQEVFMRAWRGISTFKPGSKFTTWIFQITVNYWIQDYRKGKALKRRGVTLSIDMPLGGEDSDYYIVPHSREQAPSQSAMDTELRVAIMSAIDKLDPEQRSAVVMCDIEGFSYEEISEAMDIPVGTVRSRIHRGRAKLQVALERYL